jgi:hypothetical protein
MKVLLALLRNVTNNHAFHTHSLMEINRRRLCLFLWSRTSSSIPRRQTIQDESTKAPVYCFDSSPFQVFQKEKVRRRIKKQLA